MATVNVQLGALIHSSIIWTTSCMLLLLYVGAAAHELPPHPGTVHTVQSPDGDVVDCVPRHLQPAFHHPLLIMNNHTLQEFPTHMPGGDIKFHATSNNDKIQTWHQNGSCPDGTIPILRKIFPNKVKTSKHRNINMMQTGERITSTTSSYQNITESMDNTLFAPGINPSLHEYAIGQYSKSPIYGAYGALNVWNPSLQISAEMSLAQLWLNAGKFEGTDLNTIEVGWQVNPTLNDGDSSTRLFIYWTSDYYTNTGCQNLQCPGFVQVDSTILLGGGVQPISTYDGPQFDLNPIYVYKDVNTGNWWLYFTGIFVGYWPSVLFTHLADHAEMIQWGGEIINLSADGGHTTTQMGSGHFPGEGFTKSCFARSLKAVDATFKAKDISIDDILVGTSKSGCYDAQTIEFDNWGASIFFGGPGRNPNCP